MKIILFAVLLLAATLFVLNKVRGGRKSIVVHPKLGFLNLLGDEEERLVADDRGYFGALFTAVEVSATKPPACDVLFLYCRIDDDGSIQGTRSSLREIIRDAQARVVVVASPNSDKAYLAAGKVTGFGRANLVMTLDRKAQSFGRFFQALFKDMFSGTSMPIAWVRLAPQGGPEGGGRDTPWTIFACELGQVTFK